MKTKTKDKDITVISEKSDIEGKLNMPGKVMILGSFTGSINCSTLEIYKNGKVVGTIEAEDVIIAGYVEGELACSGLLTIAKTGAVKGRVAYGNLLVELGGLLDAEVFQLESGDTKLVPFHPKGGFIPIRRETILHHACKPVEAWSYLKRNQYPI